MEHRPVKICRHHLLFCKLEICGRIVKTYAKNLYPPWSAVWVYKNSEVQSCPSIVILHVHNSTATCSLLCLLCVPTFTIYVRPWETICQWEYTLNSRDGKPPLGLSMVLNTITHLIKLRTRRSESSKRNKWQCREGQGTMARDVCQGEIGSWDSGSGRWAYVHTCVVLYDRLQVWLASWLLPPSDDYKGPTCIISGINYLSKSVQACLVTDIHNKQPGVVNQWVAAATGKILADKSLKLISRLWPQQGHPQMMCFMSVVGVEHGE
jgi:hypothetical protein